MPLDTLPDMQTRLHIRFSEFYRNRPDNVVFAIEHGFSDRGVQTLFEVVGSHLRSRGLDRDFWRKTSLPLLSAASEVGYRYRGTGTKYWPLFDDLLGVKLSVSDRPELSYLFDHAHQKYGLRKPSDTRWTKAYRHIAWPVTNALISLEIHRPLARAVRRAMRNVGVGVDDAVLLQQLRSVAVGLWSRRLTEWLEDGATATEVVRHLLSGESPEGWISGELIDRISRDLRSDRTADKALSDAKERTRQRRGQQDLSLKPAHFALVMNEKDIVRLVLVGPYLEKAVIANIPGSLSSGVIVNCADRVVDPDDFLSGGLVSLGRPETLPTGPVFQVLEDSVTDTESRNVRNILDDLEPVHPSLFEIDGESGLAIAVKEGAPLKASRHYIATSWSNDLKIFEKERMTAWSGLEYFRLDGRCAEDRRLLEALGFRFEDGLDIRLSGGLVLEQATDRMVLAPGFPLIIRTNRSGTKLILRDGASDVCHEMMLDAGEQAIAEFSPGEHSLELLQGGEKRIVQILVNEPVSGDVFSMEIDPATPTADDLISGEMTLSLRSQLPLEDVDVTGAVYASGEEIACVREIINRLPTRVGAGSRLMRELGELLVDQSTLRSGMLKLKITVSGLGEQEWKLPWRARPFRYDSDVEQWFRDGKKRGFDSVGASGSRPLFSPRMKKDLCENDAVRLLIPDIDDDEALSCGICIGEGSIIPGAQMVGMPEKLLREFGTRGEAIGVQQVLTSCFAWSLASSSDILVDHVRRRIAARLETAAAEQLCGLAWRQNEAWLEKLSLSPIGAFIEVVSERNLAEDEFVGSLSVDDILSVEQNRKRLFAEVIPDVHVALKTMGGALAVRLDEAAIEAYEQVRKEHLKAGRATFEKPDIGNEPKQWVAALEEAIRRCDMQVLASFVLPASRWQSLQRLDYAQVSEDDVIDTLEAGHVDVDRRSGFTWMGRGDFRAGLQIWLSPRRALETAEWRDSVIRQLSDRQTARAIRYAALRLRAVRSGGSLPGDSP